MENKWFWPGMVFLFISAVSYGQIRIENGTYQDGYNYLKFSSNNRIEFFSVDSEKYQNLLYQRGAMAIDPDEIPNSIKTNPWTGTYKISNEGGIDFITVRWNSGGTIKYLLLLLDDAPILYDSDSEPFFNWASNPFAGFTEGNSEWITASSSLREGKILYSTDKLGFNIGECWVEGTNGYGIGETITVNFEYAELYISSGFVSFSKPHLFRENTRIKRIRITNNSGKSETFLLKDTPHFQKIDTSSLGTEYLKNAVLKIGILEVYPGTKYADTCINSILSQ